MGSKVSGKMAAASRVVQVNTRFSLYTECFAVTSSLYGCIVQEALKVLAASLPQISPSAPPPTASISPPPRPPGPVSRLPGTPDSIDVVRDLPQKYRRRTLALDEMDYIQRGGPE
ncbi:28S ribosomal protein S36, mitochondrial [Labeo rohita]|uniref:28S ribosomal protein S36, mitochondrial n=1 Tax=Labeo rohita TaxID=84645 RepID=A0ABQ8MG05_LABRO|nr:28S ribosomal protein S36, mitochondrial [Labeo rohita]